MAKLSTGREALEKDRRTTYAAEKNIPSTMPSNEVAFFEKVSYEQFEKDYLNIFCKPTGFAISVDTTRIEEMYNRIIIPHRKTEGSLGYDFYSPVQIDLITDEENWDLRTAIIPTGIKCGFTQKNWGLFLLPRSNTGFNHRMQLDNTVGIIDNDYYNNEETEGHIFIKVTCAHYNNGHKMTIYPDKAFAQGIFLYCGRAREAEVFQTRVGGIGSTDK